MMKRLWKLVIAVFILTVLTASTAFAATVGTGLTANSLSHNTIAGRLSSNGVQ